MTTSWRPIILFFLTFWLYQGDVTADMSGRRVHFLGGCDFCVLFPHGRRHSIGKATVHDPGRGCTHSSDVQRGDGLFFFFF